MFQTHCRTISPEVGYFMDVATQSQGAIPTSGKATERQLQADLFHALALKTSGRAMS